MSSDGSLKYIYSSKIISYISSFSPLSFSFVKCFSKSSVETFDFFDKVLEDMFHSARNLYLASFKRFYFFDA